jgi:hypothetical protein
MDSHIMLNIHSGEDGILEIPATPHLTLIPLFSRPFSRGDLPRDLYINISNYHTCCEFCIPHMYYVFLSMSVA